MKSTMLAIAAITTAGFGAPTWVWTTLLALTCLMAYTESKEKK